MANEVVEKFKGIPMSELIGAPLAAACQAQLSLADASFEYINKIAFDAEGKTRLVKFDLNKPVETPSGYETLPIHVEAPFLGLVPIPSLLVDDVGIEFQMEVSASESTKSTVGSEVSTNAEAKFRLGIFGSGSVNIQGKVTSSRENTRHTNQTAKYQVRVNARQQQSTEGLSRLMDIMAQCVAPLPPVAKV